MYLSNSKQEVIRRGANFIFGPYDIRTGITGWSSQSEPGNINLTIHNSGGSVLKEVAVTIEWLENSSHLFYVLGAKADSSSIPAPNKEESYYYQISASDTGDTWAIAGNALLLTNLHATFPSGAIEGVLSPFVLETELLGPDGHILPERVGIKAFPEGESGAPFEAAGLWPVRLHENLDHATDERLYGLEMTLNRTQLSGWLSGLYLVTVESRNGSGGKGTRTCIIVSIEPYYSAPSNEISVSNVSGDTSLLDVIVAQSDEHVCTLQLQPKSYADAHNNYTFSVLELNSGRYGHTSVEFAVIPESEFVSGTPFEIVNHFNNIVVEGIPYSPSATFQPPASDERTKEFFPATGAALDAFMLALGGVSFGRFNGKLNTRNGLWMLNPGAQTYLSAIDAFESALGESDGWTPELAAEAMNSLNARPEPTPIRVIAGTLDAAPSDYTGDTDTVLRYTTNRDLTLAIPLMWCTRQITKLTYQLHALQSS